MMNLRPCSVCHTVVERPWAPHRLPASATTLYSDCPGEGTSASTSTPRWGVLVYLAVMLTACVAPSQHDESRYGTVRVAPASSLDGTWDWRPDQRQAIVEELNALSALGPTFVLSDEATADVLVRDWASPGCAGAGQYTLGTHFVEADPTCAGGLDGLRAVVGHELGHYVGMAHVCRHAGEASDCSDVGTGVAMMNPAVRYGDAVTDTDVSTPQSTPTELDLAEYRRVRP